MIFLVQSHAWTIQTGSYTKLACSMRSKQVVLLWSYVVTRSMTQWSVNIVNSELVWVPEGNRKLISIVNILDRSVAIFWVIYFTFLERTSINMKVLYGLRWLFDDFFLHHSFLRVHFSHIKWLSSRNLTNYLLLNLSWTSNRNLGSKNSLASSITSHTVTLASNCIIIRVCAARSITMSEWCRSLVDKSKSHA